MIFGISNKFWNISSSLIKCDFVPIVKMKNKLNKKCQSHSKSKGLPMINLWKVSKHIYKVFQKKFP